MASFLKAIAFAAIVLVAAAQPQLACDETLRNILNHSIIRTFRIAELPDGIMYNTNDATLHNSMVFVCEHLAFNAFITETTCVGTNSTIKPLCQMVSYCSTPSLNNVKGNLATDRGGGLKKGL